MARLLKLVCLCLNLRANPLEKADSFNSFFYLAFLIHYWFVPPKIQFELRKAIKYKLKTDFAEKII
jgi:hypothetical protein